MILAAVSNLSGSLNFQSLERKKDNLKNADVQLPSQDKVFDYLDAQACMSSLSVFQKTSDKTGFVDFMKVSKQAGVDNAEDIGRNCTKKNILGTGANSVVYKFSNPLLDRWAIKVDIKHNDYKDSFSHPIQPVDDEFRGMNMGQEIARIGNRVHILKRINGKPHSFENWSKHRAEGTKITEEDASVFLDDVKKIADFPQEAFDDYAKQLKILDDKGYKADSFNPNNYLIDYENRTIHIIDAYKYDVDAHLNTSYDLFCPLVDYPNYSRFYDVMSEKEKAEYIDFTEAIFEKCMTAAEKTGVSTSEDTFREFISRIDRRENNGGIYINAFSTIQKLL